MALITRVSRLFQADLHAVLDRIEEPEVLLRQAVREMEDELSDDEQRLKRIQHEQQQIMSRQTEVEQTLQQIEEELDICFDSAQDDLARTLIKRKLEALQYTKHLSRRQEGLSQTLKSLQMRLEENRAQLDSMRQKAELFTQEMRNDQPDDNWATPDFTVHNEDVEVAFLREKKQRSRS